MPPRGIVFNPSHYEKINVYLFTAKSLFPLSLLFLSLSLALFLFALGLTGISHRSNIVLGYLCLLAWDLSFQCCLCSFLWNRPKGITTTLGIIMLLGNVSSGRTTFAFIVVVGQLQRKQIKKNFVIGKRNIRKTH